MIPSAMLAVLERVIWAPANAGQVTHRYTIGGGESVSTNLWLPARCRCCGRPRYINERLSSERDGRDHVQDCPVLELLAALREGAA